MSFWYFMGQFFRPRQVLMRHTKSQTQSKIKIKLCDSKCSKWVDFSSTARFITSGSFHAKTVTIPRTSSLQFPRHCSHSVAYECAFRVNSIKYSDRVLVLEWERGMSLMPWNRGLCEWNLISHFVSICLYIYSVNRIVRIVPWYTKFAMLQF